MDLLAFGLSNFDRPANTALYVMLGDCNGKMRLWQNNLRAVCVGKPPFPTTMFRLPGRV